MSFTCSARKVIGIVALPLILPERWKYPTPLLNNTTCRKGSDGGAFAGGAANPAPHAAIKTRSTIEKRFLCMASLLENCGTAYAGCEPTIGRRRKGYGRAERAQASGLAGCTERNLPTQASGTLVREGLTLYR